MRLPAVWNAIKRANALGVSSCVLRGLLDCFALGFSNIVLLRTGSGLALLVGGRSKLWFFLSV